jgi:glycosyltransferase involved in cell wall biosynthesis
MLSRLIRQKGVLDYLEAASILRRRFSDVTFLLAGEVEPGHPDRISEEDIERATRESGVKYVGFVRHVEQLLCEAQVLVLPSYYREGLPRVVIEAAACAVPAICADVPGTRDGVEDGLTGFLVPPKDPVALADKIGLLLNDGELRARMGEAARKRALADFDVVQITERQIGVYNAVLASAGRDLPRA